MPVSISLLPSYMMGRRLQYVALSAAPQESGVTVNTHAEIVQFRSASDYVSLVLMVAGSIASRLQRQSQRHTRNMMSVGGTIVNCESLDPGPSLYGGGQSDTKVLEKTVYDLARRHGAPTCYSITKKGDLRPAWTHAAMTYAGLVEKLGGPVGEYIDMLPSLVGASLFSRIRDAGKTRPASGLRVSVDSLGLALLGGAVAFMGRERLAEGAVELYLLPDLVSEAYWSLLDVMGGTNTRSVASTAFWISANTGASLELVLSLEAAVSLASHYGVLKGLVPRDALKLLAAARLYVISPGKYRPMVREALVLSDVIASGYDIRLLRMLESFARISASLRGPESSHTKHTAASCISDIYLQVLDPCNTEHSYDCARSMMAIAESRHERVPADVKRLARAIAGLLPREAMRIASDAGCS